MGTSVPICPLFFAFILPISLLKNTSAHYVRKGNFNPIKKSHIDHWCSINHDQNYY